MFSNAGIPHGFCFLWNPGLLWLHVTSDLSIALAYFLIPIVLVAILRKRKDIPFNGVFFCFAAFIIACGVTHVMEVVTLWHPIYWVSGVLKAITAAISIATLIVLVRISPAVLAIPDRLADLRFRELIEDAPDAILQVDAGGTIVIANRTAEQIFGYSHDELIGCNVDRLVPMGNRGAHPGHRKGFGHSGVTRAMGEGMGDLHALRKDGSEISVEIALSRVQTEGGVLVTAVIRDVTGRKRTEGQLKLAVAQLNSLLESTTVCVLAVDSSWRIHYMNQNARALLSFGREIEGMTLWDAFPSQVPEERAVLLKVMETRQPAWYESFYPPLDLTTTVQAHPWENGGVAVFFSDISGQKRLEGQLEQANRRAESVLNSTAVCVYAVDKEWKITYVNVNARRVLSPLGDILGKNLLEVFFQQQAGTRAKLLEAMATRKPDTFESYLEPFDLSTIVSLHPLDDGGITIFFNDISEQKRLESELKRANRRAESVLENTAVGIYAVDSDWVFRYVNDNAKKLLQSADDLLGKDLWTCFPEIEPAAAAQMRKAMKTRKPASFESNYVPLDLWTRTNVHPWDKGGLTVFFSDISEQKRLERELDEERAQRNQRVEVLARLSSELAHEIKNPLAIIHARASDLAERAEDGEPLPASEVARTCLSIVQTSDRAIRILRGVAAMARVGTHDPMEDASVSGMVEQAVELVQGRYHLNGIHLETMVPADLPMVECREVQISQILVNLLNNAFDAVDGDSRSERWVRVEVSAQSGSEHENHIERLQIDVVDGGPGVAPEHRERLMETFFTTKSMGAGIGIGLSVSRTIAEDHGGQLELRECDGHTCFRLTLPVHAAHEEGVAA